MKMMNVKNDNIQDKEERSVDHEEEDEEIGVAR
jgi:hypothetical protein